MLCVVAVFFGGRHAFLVKHACDVMQNMPVVVDWGINELNVASL
ncbi:MAG: hypothetical protein ABGX68_09050 [Methylococcales bacterium]